MTGKLIIPIATSAGCTFWHKDLAWSICFRWHLTAKTCQKKLPKNCLLSNMSKKLTAKPKNRIKTKSPPFLFLEALKTKKKLNFCAKFIFLFKPHFFDHNIHLNSWDLFGWRNKSYNKRKISGRQLCGNISKWQWRSVKSVSHQK